MTTILAIDTSTGPCSAAIWHEGRISAYIENNKPVMQSASLMPMVENALQKSGLTYRDLSLVAATIGPGSFTGIRVGLASARGIAFAAGIPAAGFTTLEVLAFAAAQGADNSILSVLNAGKGEVYWQPFSGGPHPVALAEPQLGPADTVDRMENRLIAGNVAMGGITPAVTFPRADALAQLAATRPGQTLRPFYIRPPDAKLPKKI